MAVTMPRYDVVFRQLAATMIARSERGVAALIIRDSTNKSPDNVSVTKYTEIAEAARDKAQYAAANFAAICDVLTFSPRVLYVVRTTIDGALADALDALRRCTETAWVTIAGGAADDMDALVSWVAAGERVRRGYKAIVHQAAVAPDSMHVVNFINDKVVFAGERGERSGAEYLPSLIGIAAVCNVARGMTNYLCANLKSVSETGDNDAAVGKGQFVLVNNEDGEVRIGLGINSLSTLDGQTATEDMKYIEVVEVMDMMRSDILRTYRTEYLGGYKNTQDNQMLFVSAVNGYLRALAQENILNPDYDNAAFLDAAAQRAAWVAAGKTEAADWDDAAALATPYKRAMFLGARAQILFAMTDMTLVTQLM